MIKPITMILADDHGVVREGVAAFCQTTHPGEITIVGQCDNGEEAVQMILSQRPDFAVVDLNMPKMNGLEVVRRVRQAQCETHLVILSINRDENTIRELFRSGADGYVLKDGPVRGTCSMPLTTSRTAAST